MNATALIGDDEPMMLRLLSSFLAQSGYRVSTATTVEEAMAANPVGFDLMISDIRMLAGGGIRLVEWMHRHARRPKLVLMSGEFPSDETTQSVLAKADGLLKRPIHLSELRTILDTVGAA